MTDLILRQDAIALLNAEKVNAAETKDATDEAYNMAIVHCIETLTNMPSADTLATNEINALKDALAQAEGEIAELGRRLNRDDWVMIP